MEQCSFSPVGGRLEDAVSPLQVGPERIADVVGVLAADEVQPLEVGEEGAGAHVLRQLWHEGLEDLLVGGAEDVGEGVRGCQGGRGTVGMRSLVGLAQLCQHNGYNYRK